MIPVIQKEHTKILVVIICGGPIDNNAPKYPLPRLQSEMRVVPSYMTADQLYDAEDVPLTYCYHTVWPAKYK